MRNDFIRELIEISEVAKDTFLVVGDLGYGVVEPFKEAFPERFLNSGVAEQSMIGIAAGIASQGVSVFAYSIANFPTFRALEQIRNDVVGHNLPVTVVSVGAGLAYGPLGYTHHAVEDFAVMRALPGLAVYSPGDSFETRAVMRRIISRKEPAYLRLGKGGEAPIHLDVPSNPEAGISLSGPENPEWIVLSTGSIGATVLTAISSLHPALRNQTRHYSIPVFSAIEELTPELRNARGIVCVEEHQISGGFGSLVLEVLSNYGISTPVKRVGTAPGHSRIIGSHEYLLAQHRLDVGSLVAEIETFCSAA